ncbi:MAG: phosphosulfolactate synthase [Methanomassiliicoccales archaeon]
MSYFLHELNLLPPQERGVTMVLDRLSYSDGALPALFSGFADVIKIGWGLPLLMDEKELKQRVACYRDAGLHVSNGGTLLESAYLKGSHARAVRRLAQAGFDTLEISEGTVEIARSAIREMADLARKEGMRLHFEVGRKNPRNQLSLDETISRLEAALDLEPDMLIVEGRETGRGVEIYDENGEIKWDWVEEILRSIPADKLMFEAPLEKQQTELVLRIGNGVNLGNVAFASIASLATQRYGLRGDTLGALTHPSRLSGPPSARFIHYVLMNHGPMDQSAIMKTTGLDRRTVQSALSKLLSEGFVVERQDVRDLRRRVYALAPGSSRAASVSSS